MSPSRESVATLQDIYLEAAACTRCPRLANRLAVSGPQCGPPDARILFVGEAPGRRGAHRTGKPFVGDRSGDNFLALLDQVGLQRTEVYVTNAVLCCPADESRNRPPVAEEIRNCAEFLRRTIAAVSPLVVATLGAVALNAVRLAFAPDGPGWRLSERAARPIRLAPAAAGRSASSPLFPWSTVLLSPPPAARRSPRAYPPGLQLWTAVPARRGPLFLPIASPPPPPPRRTCAGAPPCSRAGSR